MTTTIKADASGMDVKKAIESAKAKERAANTKEEVTVMFAGAKVNVSTTVNKSGKSDALDSILENLEDGKKISTLEKSG